jgi:hypothetical protein
VVVDVGDGRFVGLEPVEVSFACVFAAIAVAVFLTER